MLLRPIPHATRVHAVVDGCRETHWLPRQAVLDTFSTEWGANEPLSDCYVLEILLLPSDKNRPTLLRDAIAHYGILSEQYTDDLFADPEVRIHLQMLGGVEYCFFHYTRAIEYWYCDVSEKKDVNYMADWLTYASTHNLYYYGTGQGADALFYYPDNSSEVRGLLLRGWDDPDLGQYRRAYFLNRNGRASNGDSAQHTYMNSSRVDSVTRLARTGGEGVLQYTLIKPWPVLLWSEMNGTTDMSKLVNIIQRDTDTNVILFFHSAWLDRWERSFERRALDLEWELRHIKWRGEEWYLVVTKYPIRVGMYSRTMEPKSPEVLLTTAQRLHADELCNALGSTGSRKWNGNYIEFYAATNEVMIHPEQAGAWTRSGCYRTFEQYHFDFGTGVLGAWRSPDRHYIPELLHPEYVSRPTPFEKPLSPIPPMLPSTPLIETTFLIQDDQWLRENFGGDSDNLEDFNKRVRKHLSPDLPPLKFIRPGQLDLDKMTDELSSAYGAPKGRLRKMLEIWAQYLDRDPGLQPRQGSFDRAGPTGTGWSPDGVFDNQGRLDIYEIAAKAKRFQGRDVLVHRETGVKVYVIRRRYGMVTLQSESGQEFVLNNDIVETVYDKESK